MAARKTSRQPTAANPSKTPAKDRILEGLRDGIRFQRVMDLVWPRRDQLLAEMAAGRKNWKPKTVGKLEDEFFRPLESSTRSQLRNAWIQAMFRRIVYCAWKRKQLRLSHLEWFIDARLRRKLDPESAWQSLPWKARRLSPNDRMGICLFSIISGEDPLHAWISAYRLAGLEPTPVDFRYLLTAGLAMGRNSTALNDAKSLDGLKAIRKAIQDAAPLQYLDDLVSALRPQLQAAAKGQAWSDVGTLDAEFFDPLESGARSDLRKAWNRALYRVLVNGAVQGCRLELDHRQQFVDARLRLRQDVAEIWDSLGWRRRMNLLTRQVNYLMRISGNQHPMDAWIRSAELFRVEPGLVDFSFLLVTELAKGNKLTALANAKRFDALTELRAAIAQRKLSLTHLEALGLALRKQLLAASKSMEFDHGALEMDFITVLRFDQSKDRFTDDIHIGREWNDALFRRVIRTARHKHFLQLSGRDCFLDGRIRLGLDQHAARAQVPAGLDLREHGSQRRGKKCYVDLVIGSRRQPGRNPQRAWEELFGTTRMNVEDIFIGWLAAGESPATAAQWAVDETVPGRIKALRRIVG